MRAKTFKPGGALFSLTFAALLLTPIPVSAGWPYCTGPTPAGGCTVVITGAGCGATVPISGNQTGCEAFGVIADALNAVECCDTDTWACQQDGTDGACIGNGTACDPDITIQDNCNPMGGGRCYEIEGGCP